MTGDGATHDRPTAAVTTVTLLTQPDCALCEHAKQVLARVSADHRLRVEEIDLHSPRGQQLALSAGVLFAPGVLLDGKPYAHGRLSERALRRTLTRRPTSPQPTTPNDTTPNDTTPSVTAPAETAPHLRK